MNKHDRPNSQRKKKWIFLVILIVGVFAFYIPSLKFDFIIDDPILIVQREETLENLKNIPEYFNEHYWNVKEGAEVYYYRPMVTVINAINLKIAGLEASAFHLVNILLHILNITLLFFVLGKIFRNYFIAYMTAILFAFHPLAIPSVAWISGRTDLLAMLFMLLSFRFFIRYSDGYRSKFSFLISLLFYFAACLCKEIAILLPLFAFLYLLFIKKDRIKDLILTPAGFLLPLGTYLLMRASAFSMIDKAFISFGIEPGNILYIPNILLYYLKNLILPGELVFIPNSSEILRATPTAIVFFAAILAFFILAWIYLNRKYRLGIIWFAVFFMPFTYLIPVGYPGAAYYLYIPLVGLILILVGFIEKLSKVIDAKSKRENLGRKATAILYSLILIYFGYFGFLNMMNFKDEITLWKSSLMIENDNIEALEYLGREYYKMQEYQKAVLFWEKASSIAPNRQSYYSDIIAGYGKLGQYAKADSLFIDAQRSGADIFKIYANYTVTLIERQKYRKAIEILKESLEKYPQKIQAEKYMGMVYLYYLADTSSASDHFMLYVESNPNDKDTLFLKQFIE
ncbi:MAG: tetratricopeptide repeat protein [Candidatus Zixiibacteriota bacterium]